MLPLSKEQVIHLKELNNNQCSLLKVGILEVMAICYLDTLYIYENTCPHQNKALICPSSSCFDETFSLIECQSHGAQFLPMNGLCVAGPCIGKQLVGYHLKQFKNTYYLQKKLS